MKGWDDIGNQQQRWLGCPADGRWQLTVRAPAAPASTRNVARLPMPIRNKFCRSPPLHADLVHPEPCRPLQIAPYPLMPKAVLAPRARIECRSTEWLVRSLAKDLYVRRFHKDLRSSEQSHKLQQSAGGGCRCILFPSHRQHSERRGKKEIADQMNLAIHLHHQLTRI